jgi:hypothetical protein
MSTGLPVAAAAPAKKPGAAAAPPMKCRTFAALRRVPLQGRQGASQAPRAAELGSDPASKSARNAFADALDPGSARSTWIRLTKIKNRGSVAARPEQTHSKRSSAERWSKLQGDLNDEMASGLVLLPRIGQPPSAARRAAPLDVCMASDCLSARPVSFYTGPRHSETVVKIKLTEKHLVCRYDLHSCKWPRSAANGFSAKSSSQPPER